MVLHQFGVFVITLFERRNPCGGTESGVAVKLCEVSTQASGAVHSKV